nr:MAG TPA: hypothetical protein [Caudoviricetes sp.]
MYPKILIILRISYPESLCHNSICLNCSRE